MCCLTNFTFTSRFPNILAIAFFFFKNCKFANYYLNLLLFNTRRYIKANERYCNTTYISLLCLNGWGYWYNPGLNLSTRERTRFKDLWKYYWTLPVGLYLKYKMYTITRIKISDVTIKIPFYLFIRIQTSNILNYIFIFKNWI
jgi:hypothetical protein